MFVCLSICTVTNHRVESFNFPAPMNGTISRKQTDTTEPNQPTHPYMSSSKAIRTQLSAKWFRVDGCAVLMADRRQQLPDGCASWRCRTGDIYYVATNAPNENDNVVVRWECNVRIHLAMETEQHNTLHGCVWTQSAMCLGDIALCPHTIYGIGYGYAETELASLQCI